MSTTENPIKILDKLESLIDEGNRIIDSGDYQICTEVVWYMRARSILNQIYSDDDAIILKIKAISDKIRKNRDTSPELFKEMFSYISPITNFLKNIKEGKSSKPFPLPVNKNVFIIHGHDEVNMHRLVRILKDTLHLNPIIMMRKPGMSRALLTKFEEEAEKCSYAIAIFTPDDNILNIQNDKEIKYKQARPNVINEAGWFIGRLGKERLLILLKEGTAIHTDYDGVSRIQFRDNIEDKFLSIQEELRALKLI